MTSMPFSRAAFSASRTSSDVTEKRLRGESSRRLTSGNSARTSRDGGWARWRDVVLGVEIAAKKCAAAFVRIGFRAVVADFSASASLIENVQSAVRSCLVLHPRNARSDILPLSRRTR